MAKTRTNTKTDAGDLAALISRAQADRNAGKDGLPPVERWNPPYCGDIDMEIRSDGTWFYMGTPIGRPALVRLFSTVLRADEDGKIYLVTPVEKIGIRVVDAPFLAVEMTVSEEKGQQVLTFRTNVGDVVRAGPDNPLRFVVTGETDQLKPYILVRGRLEALVNRAVTYDLLALGEEIEIDGEATYAIRSAGAVFPVMPMNRLEAKRLTDTGSLVPPGFDAEGFRLRARKHDPDHAFGPEPAHLGHGDHVLNPGLVSGLVDAKLRDAAVLVPVTDDGPDARVILTRRATALRKHSGQVAFPGGSIDPEDGSVEIAAMREAEEEIGLDRSFVEPVGRLPVYMTTPDSGLRRCSPWSGRAMR
jgi:hypothetical protein